MKRKGRKEGRSKSGRNKDRDEGKKDECDRRLEETYTYSKIFKNRERLKGSKRQIEDKTSIEIICKAHTHTHTHTHTHVSIPN